MLKPQTLNHKDDRLTEAELAPQMIPGYTGHVSGLKRTIGLTYGNTTGPLLGKISPAFIPMHDSREQEKEIVLQRTGYPTYQHRYVPCCPIHMGAPPNSF